MTDAMVRSGCDRNDLRGMAEGGGERSGDGVDVTWGHGDDEAGVATVGEARLGGGGHEVEVDADGAHDDDRSSLGVDPGGRCRPRHP